MIQNHPQLTSQQQEAVQQFLQATPLVRQIAERLHTQAASKKAFLVGGVVRDILLGLPLEQVDVDIEVHGVTLDELAEVLSTFGVVDYVGKSFGVLKLHGTNIDWALPRTDSVGRKPQVTVQDLPLEVALRRRDLTMNAMALDVRTLALYDPFGGLQDLQQHILRSPDPAFFTEDPLRFYRVMQFIGRFEMHPDEQLNAVCKSMDISQISRERIETEFNKLFLKSRTPSRGIRWLADIGRLAEILPELAQLRGVEQDPIWHPEGDVFEHTMQALDAAARQEYETSDEKLLVMYATLCHDLGKKVAMQRKDGRIHNYGHDEAGVPLAKAMLQRISTHASRIAEVCKLVYYHMRPAQLVSSKASAAAYKRLAKHVAPLSLKTLSLLAYADNRGRNPARGEPLSGAIERVDQFVTAAQQAGVFFVPEQPVLKGADIMDCVKPGPEMGKVLEKAYEIQINEGITDKTVLKKRVCGK